MGCRNRGVGAGLREGVWKTVERVRVGDLWRRGNAGRQRGAERMVTAHIYRDASLHIH